MANKQDLLVEAYNRGLLPADKAQLVEESFARGILQDPTARRQALAEEMTHIPPREAITEEMIEEAPQTIGGITGGILGAAGGPWGALGGAGLGGAAGKAFQDIYRQFSTPELASKTSAEAAKRIAMAGGEEILYEAGGQLVGRVAGKAYHIFRPKVDAGIEELQGMMRKYGGNLTKAERTSNWTTQQVDSLVRGSLSGKGIMKRADDVNELALKRWQEALVTDITSGAPHLSDEAFGGLVKETLADGKGAFKASMREVYGSFDELVQTKIVKTMREKEVVSDIVDTAGKPISTTIREQIEKEIRPVDVRPLKQEAANLIERLQRTADLGKSDFGGETITKVLNLDDAMRFSDAQAARSHLLDLKRVAKRTGEAKLEGSITAFEKKLTKAMDEAAMRQGPDVFAAYKKIKKEAEKGYSAFNDKLISEIMRDETGASKVGEMLYSEGKVEQIYKLQVALRRAAKYDKTIKPKQVFNVVREKYLQTLLNRATRRMEVEAGETLAEHQAKAGVVDATAMLRAFQKPKSVRTMDAMLSPDHREKLFQFSKALAITQTKSAAGLSMLMQLTQGGVAIQAVSGKKEAMAKAVGFFVPLNVMAHMMTNPTTVKLLTSAAKTPAWAKQAPVVTTKLLAAYDKAKAEVEGREGVVEGFANTILDTEGEE